VVQWGIAVEFVPRRPIFEKCPHLREKGGVLTLKTPRGVCAYPYTRVATLDSRLLPSLQPSNCFRNRYYTEGFVQSDIYDLIHAILVPSECYYEQIVQNHVSCFSGLL
jgi:hypothetical protein